MSTPVTITIDNLAADCWPALPNDFIDALRDVIHASVEGMVFLTIGPDEPSADDRDKAWIKTTAGGYPVGLYLYKGGWVWRHEKPASGKERVLFVGTEAEAWAYDGGDGTDPSLSPPTDTTGAMWQVDHDFDFRFPIGAGTNGTAYAPDAAKTIALGDTGGEERHVLTAAETAPHTHDTKFNINDTDGGNQLSTLYGAPDGTMNPANTDKYTKTSESACGTGSPAAATAHNTLPPYKGVYFIKRTARIYRTA